MKLKELREQKGLQQNEVANALKIGRTSLNQYENEKNQPPLQTLCQLADYYGVSLDYLCEHQSKAIELPPNTTEDDRQAIFTYLALPELKKAVIRGEIKAIAII